MRSTLEMKRAFRSGRLSFEQSFWDAAEDDTVHPPAAPLRAYRFTSAGGRAPEIVDGEPRFCVFKIGFDPNDVVMDEGHHLTRPRPLYQRQLANLRQYVYTARNVVLALCTGTIGGNSVSECLQ